MPHVIFPEYREQFKATKYPFMDTATLTSINGDLTLPKDVFCDASIYIPGAIAPIYLQRIEKDSSGCIITVSDYSKNYTASGKVSALSDRVTLRNDKGLVVGLLVASLDLSYFTSLSYGVYEFASKATSFAPRCVISLKDTGVTSVNTPNQEPIDGNIWLVGKQGVILRYEKGAIRVDVVGEPLFNRENEEFTPPVFLQTINGIPSDEYGNFLITVLEHDDILRVDNSADGITIYAAGV